MWDGLQEILFTLRQNKLRTVLTAFGVFWGIFMLVLLLGAGRGMQNGIYEDFGSDVRDFIIVWTGETSVAFHGMGPGRRIQLRLEDIEALKQQVPGIKTISAERFVENGQLLMDARPATDRSSASPTNTSGSRKTFPSTSGARIIRSIGSNTGKSCSSDPRWRTVCSRRAWNRSARRSASKTWS
jgi:putative ABC transport system permease protein